MLKKYFIFSDLHGIKLLKRLGLIKYSKLVSLFKMFNNFNQFLNTGKLNKQIYCLVFCIFLFFEVFFYYSALLYKIKFRSFLQLNLLFFNLVEKCLKSKQILDFHNKLVFLIASNVSFLLFTYLATYLHLKKKKILSAWAIGSGRF